MKILDTTWSARASVIAALVLVTGAPPAFTTTAQATQAELVKGQVVKVDAQRGRITLRHARINSINMDAMTMPFKVRTAAMLGTLKPGDKVDFSVAVQDDELVITELRPVKAVK